MLPEIPKKLLSRRGLDISLAENTLQWQQIENAGDAICGLHPPLRQELVEPPLRLREISAAKEQIMGVLQQYKETTRDLTTLHMDGVVSLLRQISKNPLYNPQEDTSFEFKLRGIKDVLNEETNISGGTAPVSFAFVQVLEVGDNFVVVEAKPTTPAAKQQLGATVAIKFIGQSFTPEDNKSQAMIETVGRDLENRIDAEVRAVRAAATKVHAQTAEEVQALRGLAIATHTAHLVPPSNKGPTFQAGTFLYSAKVTINPVMEGSSAAMKKAGGTSERLRLLVNTKSKGNATQKEMLLLAKEYVISRAIAELALVHETEITHNNITEDSILVNKDGTVLLGDFDNSRESGENANPRITRYMAPEQAYAFLQQTDVPATEQSDAFMLGVTAYSLFTGGYLPYGIDSVPVSQRHVAIASISSWKDGAVNTKEAKMLCPAFELRRAGVPETWVTLVSLLLEPDPKKRPSPRQIVYAFPDIFGKFSYDLDAPQTGNYSDAEQ